MKFNCSYTELVDIHKLVPHPKNPNKHTDQQIDRLSKIIDFQGQRHPVIVSKTSGFIVAGHGRLQSMQKLGWEKVAVDYQEFENEAQEYAFLVADNAIAEWSALDLSQINMDFLELGPELDLDQLGIKDFVVEPIEKFEPQSDEDEVPELKEEPVTKRGDIWLLGNHRLMCGDSTMFDDVEKLMNGEKADMVFTDPPYGIGFKYNSHQDTTGDDYKDFCRDWFHNINLFSDFIVISTGWAYNHFWYSNGPKDCFYWICKNKRTGGSISHFRKVEPIFIWGKPHNKYDFDFWEQTTQIEEDLKGQHTCPKPVGLIEQIIKGNKEKGIILDVFGGSGTTMVASEKAGMISRLMEKDERYCDVIINRWQKYTGKKAILESNKQTYDELKAAKHG